MNPRKQLSLCNRIHRKNIFHSRKSDAECYQRRLHRSPTEQVSSDLIKI